MCVVHVYVSQHVCAHVCVCSLVYFLKTLLDSKLLQGQGQRNVLGDWVVSEGFLWEAEGSAN